MQRLRANARSVNSVRLDSSSRSVLSPRNIVAATARARTLHSLQTPTSVRPRRAVGPALFRPERRDRGAVCVGGWDRIRDQESLIVSTTGISRTYPARRCRSLDLRRLSLPDRRQGAPGCQVVVLPPGRPQGGLVEVRERNQGMALRDTDPPERHHYQHVPHFDCYYAPSANLREDLGHLEEYARGNEGAQDPGFTVLVNRAMYANIGVPFPPECAADDARRVHVPRFATGLNSSGRHDTEV